MIQRGSPKYNFLLLEQRVQLAKVTIEHMINMGFCMRQRGFQLWQCILIIQRRYTLQFFYQNRGNSKAMEEVWSEIGELEEIFYLLIMESKMIEVSILEKYIKSQTQWAVNKEAFNKQISKVPFFQIYSNPFVTVKILRRLLKCQQIYVAFKPYICTALIGIGLQTDPLLIKISKVQNFQQAGEMKKSLIQELTDIDANSSQDTVVDKNLGKQEIKPNDKEVVQSLGLNQIQSQVSEDISGEEITLTKSKFFKNKGKLKTEYDAVHQKSMNIAWLPIEDFITFFIENYVFSKTVKVGIFAILKQYFEDKPNPNDAIKVFNNKQNMEMIVQALKDNGIQCEDLVIKNWSHRYCATKTKKGK